MLSKAATHPRQAAGWGVEEKSLISRLPVQYPRKLENANWCWISVGVRSDCVYVCVLYHVFQQKDVV